MHISSFAQNEHSKYEVVKEKLKETATSELSLTKDILTNAESIANSSVVEIIQPTRGQFRMHCSYWTKRSMFFYNLVLPFPLSS